MGLVKRATKDEFRALVEKVAKLSLPSEPASGTGRWLGISDRALIDLILKARDLLADALLAVPCPKCKTVRLVPGRPGWATCDWKSVV